MFGKSRKKNEKAVERDINKTTKSLASSNIAEDEFIVKDFRQNSDFLKHFQDRLTSLNNIPGDDLYIKFSFRYCFDLNMLPNPYHNERQIKYVKRSNDSYIYVPCNQFVILDDVSFHF